MRGNALRLRTERPGSVLAVVAVSLVALVSVIALAVDIGMLYSARGEAQRAADAAALAGASVFISVDYDDAADAVKIQAAEDRAVEYATYQSVMNEGIEADEVETTVLLNEEKVIVVIRRAAVPLIFARIFGMNSSGVVARAAAEASVVDAGRVPCVKPFALPNMWPNANPETDIYQRDGQAPIWDFDVHLQPPNELPDDILNSGHCGGNGNNFSCEPEVWTFEGGYTEDTGYGSTARNGADDYRGVAYEKDRGRRVPMKINFPTDGPQPSFWFPWRMPGNAGAGDYTESLKKCIDYADINQEVEIDGVETENGNMPKPTYDAIIDLIDNGNGTGPADPGAYWDEDPITGEGVIRGSVYEGNLEASPRVITVALFNPEDMTAGHTSMRFVDFATFFLEDPRVVYPHVNPAHHAPITGRYIGTVAGTSGSEQTGPTPKRLRLVE